MSEGVIKFKSIKSKKQFRKRRNSSEDEEDSSSDAKKSLIDTKDSDDQDFDAQQLKKTQELQKLRQKSSGLSHVTLASGKKFTKLDSIMCDNVSDPFKLKTGGLLSLSAAKAAKALQDPQSSSGTNENEKVVGTQFSKETQIRDEDEEMQKFIDIEMEKRRGRSKDDEESNTTNKYLTPEERALMALPEYLSRSTFKKNEEMLSSQMLSGIPEVDLGIDEKIRNIEATEKAKKKANLNDGQMKIKSATPTASNVSVNYRNPNKLKINEDDSNKNKKKYEIFTQNVVKVGEDPQEKIVRKRNEDCPDSIDKDKASDEIHVNKFKQHFQKK